MNLMINLVMALSPWYSSDAHIANAQGTIQDPNLAFNVVANQEGWVLQNNSLFWTHDLGQTWIDITPASMGDSRIASAFFLDADQGWLVISQANQGVVSYQIFRTTQGGARWENAPLDLFSPDELNSLSGFVFMQWITPETGWLLLKRGSGVNFSSGFMFQTRDGGQSWERLNPPMGEPFFFIDENLGWMAGGPDGRRLYRTQDGGLSWQDIAQNFLPTHENSELFFYLPELKNSSRESDLLFPVLEKQSGEQDAIKIYTTADQGVTWNLQQRYSLRNEVDPQAPLPLEGIDPAHYSLMFPGETRVVKVDGRANELKNVDGAADDLVQISMAGLGTGWGKFIESACETSTDPQGENLQRCTTTTKLMVTQDSGVTWQPMSLPSGEIEIVHEIDTQMDIAPSISPDFSISSYPRAEIYIGQAFDKCEIGTLSQMQTWYISSPYKVVNLYIGGSSRGCSNQALNATYVTQLAQQGWKFIPTWVGPQAPCSVYSTKFSSNQSTAYSQGVNEAVSAVNTMASLGLTLSNKTGSVIYYDLEAYTGSDTCYAAASSFINGWTAQIKATSNLSGVYGSACGSRMSNFFGLPNPPQLLWLAAWYHAQGSGFYDPSASVWNVSCISNSYYVNHQRIRQYEGTHNEKWGNITFTMDSNVADGVIANLNGVVPFAICQNNPGYRCMFMPIIRK